MSSSNLSPPRESYLHSGDVRAKQVLIIMRVSSTQAFVQQIHFQDGPNTMYKVQHKNDPFPQLREIGMIHTLNAAKINHISILSS